jgi:hypothetical protein
MSLSKCLQLLEGGSVRTPGIVDQLKEQLSGVVRDLNLLYQTMEESLEERRQELDNSLLL